MRVTRACGYAIRAVVSMAAHKGGPVPITSQLTAELRGIPKLFLLKVLNSLVQAGILYSKRGPNGGYQLARPPREITLLSIVEAVDGLLRGQVPSFPRADPRLVRRLEKVCQKIGERTRKQLRRVRVADLVKAAEGAVE